MKVKNILHFSVGLTTIGLVWWLFARQQELLTGILIGFVGTFLLIGLVYLVHLIGKLIVDKASNKHDNEFDDFE